MEMLVEVVVTVGVVLWRSLSVSSLSECLEMEGGEFLKFKYITLPSPPSPSTPPITVHTAEAEQ